MEKSLDASLKSASKGSSTRVGREVERPPRIRCKEARLFRSKRDAERTRCSTFLFG